MFKTYIILLAVLLIFSCDSKSESKQRLTVTTDLNPLSRDSLIYDNDTIVLYQIDSVGFFKQKSAAVVVADTIPYIKDFERAKNLLRGRVTFGGWNDDTNQIDSLLEGEMIAFVRFRNSDTINSNVGNFFSDNWFIAYFPTEEIVLFEGGHSSDYSIDLRNGRIGAQVVGNPMYIFSSPTKEYRLNGWFPGQECSGYFLERRVNEGYQKLTDIPLHVGAVDFLLCNLEDSFWVSDDELYFRNNFYGEDKRLGFFKLKIK